MTDDERGPEMGLLEQLFGIYTPRIQPPPVMFSDLPPAAINELQCGVLPQLNVGSLRLRKGEICHYVDKCCLFIKKVERHYRRVSRGSSFHVAKGLTVHTGSGESHPIEQELPEYTPGYLYITNQRVIFTAREKGFEKDLLRLTSVTGYTDAIVLQFGNKVHILLSPSSLAAQQVLLLLK